MKCLSSPLCLQKILAPTLLALLALTQEVKSHHNHHQQAELAIAASPLSSHNSHHLRRPIVSYHNYSKSPSNCRDNRDDGQIDDIGIHSNISASQQHINRLLGSTNLIDDQRAESDNLTVVASSAKTTDNDGHFCATTAQLAAVAASGRSQEAAVGATVNLVRLILVILICVLLVKLCHPKLAESNSNSENSKVDALSNGGRGSSSKKAHDSQQHGASSNRCDECTSAALLRRQSSTLNRWIVDSKKRFDSRNLINLTANYLSSKLSSTPLASAAGLRQRRSSQPDLMSSAKEAEVAAGLAATMERKRRHSDTCLAHLKLPPGPRGLPFLGYLPFVGHEIHLTLTSLSERYGPIYQIFLGGIRVVVLNDAALVRQAFKQPVFSGRPDTQLTRILQGYGIVNSDGALWKEQRAFLHSALRKLGAKSLMSGSNGLEAKIQNQVKEFVNDLSVHASEGKPCQVRPIVARAVSSVVGSIVMNLTYRKYEEKEKFDRLIELMQEGFRLFTIAMPLDFIPIFRFLPGVSYAYKKMQRNRAETSAFFQGVADEHRKYLSETFNINSDLDSTNGKPLDGVAGSREQQQQHNHHQLQQVQPRRQPLHPYSANGGGGGTGRHFLNSSAQVKVDRQAEERQTGRQATTGSHHAQQQQQQQQHRERQQQQLLLQKQQRESSQGQEVTVQQEQRLQQQQQVVVAGESSSDVQKEQQLQTNGNSNATNGTNSDIANSATSAAAGNSNQEKRHVELENIVARDLVDAYLVQQRKHEKDGKENYFSDQQLVQIMSDIFSAGLETVTSTIEWSILFLILNPDCQAKIHEEIEQVIGRERAPQLEDLSQMPYTEATIYEVLRRSNVIALGNAHATLADATIAGYRIPKGTQVLPNLYGIHMNPQLWNEPQRFNPSRFIVNDKAQKPDYFIPFSVGRRMCLGDVLAKMEVFLFLVGLLQKYELTVAHEDRNNPPQVKGTIGVSNTPASFRVALKHRKSPTHSSVQIDNENRDPTTGN